MNPEAVHEESENEASTSPSDSEIYQAHKINHLINEGEVTAAEVSQADAVEVDRMVSELFDPNYIQNPHRIEVMKEKTPGQRVEDSVVEILNESQKIFHAEHASYDLDHNEKADIVLSVEGEEERILVQLTTMKDEQRLQEKLEHLPAHTIFVELPGTRAMSELIKEGNADRLRGIAQNVIRKVLRTMQVQTEYQGLYQRLSQRLTSTRT